jgi:hypothetical protein
MDDNAFFLEARGALKGVNPNVQRVAFLDFVNVQSVDGLSANFMRGLVALHDSPKIINLRLVFIARRLALVPALVEQVDRVLVDGVFVLESLLNVTKQKLLDSFERLSDVTVQLDLATGSISGHTVSEELGLHQVLHQRCHLSHVATFNALHEALNGGALLREHASDRKKRGCIISVETRKGDQQALHVCAEAVWKVSE